MREIKFRVWDKHDKEMKYDSPIWCTCSQGDYSGVTDKSINDMWEYYDLMQFTGLKDKNGKEIYEGDIIKQDLMREKRIVGVETIEVKMDWIDCDTFEIWGYPLTQDSKHIEVIGNIYENPELIQSNT